jgi:hypothetical protein
VVLGHAVNRDHLAIYRNLVRQGELEPYTQANGQRRSEIRRQAEIGLDHDMGRVLAQRPRHRPALRTRLKSLEGGRAHGARIYAAPILNLKRGGNHDSEFYARLGPSGADYGPAEGFSGETERKIALGTSDEQTFWPRDWP